MGLLSNSVSLRQYRVVGEPPVDDLFTWAAGKLAARSFIPIDQGSDELSIGWVPLGNPPETGFLSEADCRRDHWLTFSLRRDQRKIPSLVLRRQCEQMEREFLAQNPGLKRVPKPRREELREAVRGSLMAKTLPIPQIFDAVWNTETALVSFASLSQKTAELFEAEFCKTFDGLRLVLHHPYARAAAVLPDELQPALKQANRADNDTVLELISANSWLGEEFLAWMLYQTLNGSGRQAVRVDGPEVIGAEFIAYLDQRTVLAGGGEEGIQRLTVSGPQDSFAEVRAGLAAGKRLQEATIRFELGEDEWKLTLKGEMFQFGGFRCPKVELEKDELTDPEMEQVALFFERMLLLQKGEQLFDSLYRSFLEQRLGDDWEQTRQAIEQWLQTG